VHEPRGLVLSGWIRGGSWFDYPPALEATLRHWTNADYRIDYLGFRLAGTLRP